MKFELTKVKDVFDVQWGDTNKTKSSYVPEGYLAYSASGPDGFLDTYDYDCEGVVLSAIGANCGATYFAEGKWSCIKNTMRILPRPELSDATYFYYLSKTRNFWPKRGSAQPFISQTDVRELEVQLPPLEIQRAVGRALRQIDEKIAANSAMSSNLEQIAQTIFKSWFVDFDPVHAKARGEQPEGMDAETAALFPGSFEDSEIGPIPTGWTVEPVGDVLENVGGATPSTANADYWDGGIDWTTPKDLANNNQLISLGSIRKISDKGLKRISSGLLSEKSVLFSSRAPIGYIAISAVPTAVNQGFIAFPNSEQSYSPMYIANWLHFNLQEIENRAGGTSFSEISKSAFRDIPFVVPNPLVADKYLSLTAEILEQLVNLAKQNKTLEALRDSLLPRLISGELAIPEELLGE